MEALLAHGFAAQLHELSAAQITIKSKVPISAAEFQNLQDVASHTSVADDNYSLSLKFHVPTKPTGTINILKLYARWFPLCQNLLLSYSIPKNLRHQERRSVGCSVPS